VKHGPLACEQTPEHSMTLYAVSISLLAPFCSRISEQRKTFFIFARAHDVIRLPAFSCEIAH
jgi:hypothetical protein